MYSETLSYIL